MSGTSNIVFTPRDAALGADVSGISLSGALDDADIATIEAGLVAHKVLFFHDQSMTTQDQLAFTRRFGPLEVHPFLGKKLLVADPRSPELVVVESKPDDPIVVESWHSDVTWRETPSLGSVLRITHCPQSGGNTRWADMTAAYEDLSDAMQAHLSGLVAVHDWHIFRAALRAGGVPEDKLASLQATYPPMTHPVIRTHPVSGRKIIYVNDNFTVRIEGMSDRESAALLRTLYALADIPAYRVSFSWAPGCVAFWDNRSTQHSVTGDVQGYRRLERTTVVGDRPF